MRKPSLGLGARRWRCWPAARTCRCRHVHPERAADRDPERVAIAFQPQIICQNLAGTLISPAEIDLPSWPRDDRIRRAARSERHPRGRARFHARRRHHAGDAAALQAAGPHRVARSQRPAIQFQINLPVRWNGRSVQYGGGASTAC
jgi:hypothetical protein